MFFGGGIQLQELVKHNKKSCDSWANSCKLQPAQIGQTVKTEFLCTLKNCLCTSIIIIIAIAVSFEVLSKPDFKRKYTIYFPNSR